MNSHLRAEYRLLMIAPSLEKKGGVADFCRMLIRNLSHDFQVFYFGVGGEQEKYSVAIRVIRFLQSLYQLAKIIRKDSFDIIHINPSFKFNSLFRDSIYLAIIFAFHLSPRTMVFFHGWDQDFFEKIRKRFFWKKVTLAIYKRARIILMLFNKAREQLITLGISPEKIKIATTMFEESEKSGADHNPLENKGRESVRILFMSRFLKEKGIFIAAEVVRLLVKDGFLRFKFIFAGDGPAYDRLVDFFSLNKLRDYVEITGFVSGENKRRVLEKSDILLFPTYYGEGCPVVVLEAMGAGLAIISTPVGAIAEIVKQNEGGFIIDSKDPHVFCQAIIKLTEEESLLRSMQRENMKKARENYEAGAVTRRIESFYMSIIND